MEEAASVLELTEDDYGNECAIKTSYRRLCLIHHPDKGGCGDRFKKIQAAYERWGETALIRKTLDPMRISSSPAISSCRFMCPDDDEDDDEDECEDVVLILVQTPMGRVLMEVPRAFLVELQMRKMEEEKRMKEIRARIERSKERARLDKILLLSHPPTVLFSCVEGVLKFSLSCSSRPIVLTTAPDSDGLRPLLMKDPLMLQVQINETVVKGLAGGGGAAGGGGKVKNSKASMASSPSPWKEVKFKEGAPGCFIMEVKPPMAPVQPSTRYFMRARVGERRLTDNLRSTCAWSEWGPGGTCTTDP